MNRREFLARSGARAAAAAAPAAAFAAHAGCRAREELGEALDAGRAALEAGLREVADGVDGLSRQLRRVELQQQWLLWLVVLSFIIDGGLAWQLATLPALPLA